MENQVGDLELDLLSEERLGKVAKPSALTLYPNDVVPARVKVAYSVGDLTVSSGNAVLGFFLLPFFLEVARVKVLQTTLIMVLGRLWDAVTDPLVGRLSDRTNSRWGRRRPWLLFFCVPFVVSYALLWQTYGGAFDGQPWVKFVYYLIFLLLTNSFYTCLIVPHLALIPELTSSDEERTVLASYKIVVTIIAAFLGSVGHAIIIDQFDNKRTGYLVSACIFAGVLVFPPLITFWFTKENIELQKQRREQTESVGFIDAMKAAFSNRPFAYNCLVFLLSTAAIQSIQINLYLYVEYVLDAEEYLIYLLGLVQGTIVLSTPMWTLAANKFDKKPVYYAGSGVLIACALSLLCLQEGWLAVSFVVAFFAGVGISACLLIPLSTLPETIDVDELRTSQRREGLFYGLFIFLQKSAVGIMVAFGGVLLHISGFELDDEEFLESDTISADAQPNSVKQALRLLVGLIPSCLLLLSLIFVYGYPLDSAAVAHNSHLLRKKKEKMYSRLRSSSF